MYISANNLVSGEWSEWHINEIADYAVIRSLGCWSVGGRVWWLVLFVT